MPPAVSGQKEKSGVVYQLHRFWQFSGAKTRSQKRWSPKLALVNVSVMPKQALDSSEEKIKSTA